MSVKGIYLNHGCEADSSLSLHSCGIGIFEKSFCHGPNVRSEYIIHYITEGQGYLETSDGTFPFGSGDIFCIYPGEVIKYYTSGSKCHFAFVNFVGTDGKKMYETIGVSHSKPVLHINCNSAVEVVQQCMYYLKANDVPSQLRLNAYLLEFLSLIEKNKNKQKAKHKDLCVDKGVAFMDFYFNTDISIDDIAAAAGVERSYFYRVFKQCMGIAPITYLTNVRISKAKELIEAGIDFKTVASAVGISDVYYFSKLFSKVEGITPSAYRKSIKP